LARLDGTWRFDIENPTLNYGTGRYAGAQVSVSGDRITVQSPVNADTFSRFGAPFAGEHRISCRADSCGFETTGLVVEGDNIRVVNRATLEPDTAGAGTCGAPAVPNAGFVEITSPSSFRFLTGTAAAAGLTGDSCSSSYQVVWTVVATKVS
jgi:hypothetical protein